MQLSLKRIYFLMKKKRLLPIKVSKLENSAVVGKSDEIIALL
jgi:hypothetical protein